jgi:hypothetical protein
MAIGDLRPPIRPKEYKARLLVLGQSLSYLRHLGEMCWLLGAGSHTEGPQWGRRPVAPQLRPASVPERTNVAAGAREERDGKDDMGEPAGMSRKCKLGW